MSNTITAFPTLPTDFEPASECLEDGNFWQWWWSPLGDRRTVMGSPDLTTKSCFPTPGSPTGTYLGYNCPSRYTPACGSAQSATVTCCPDVHSFTCAGDSNKKHGDMFRCVSQWDSEASSKHATGGSLTLTITNMEELTTKPTVVPFSPKLHLFANGIVYERPVLFAPEPTGSASASASESTATADTSRPTGSNGPTNVDTSSASSTSSSDTSSSSSSSGSLSAGASAGIGVGAAVVVIAVAGLGFFLWRRRKRANAPYSAPPVEAPPGYPQSQSQPQTYGAAAPSAVVYAKERHEMDNAEHTINELEAAPVRGELPGKK